VAYSQNRLAEGLAGGIKMQGYWAAPPAIFPLHKDSGIATNCLQTGGRNFLNGISNLRGELKNSLDTAVVLLKGFLIG
jgi:hypothetical protein